MPKPFDELREQLLRAGVAPRHVRRYLTELTDHLADLRREEMHSARNAGDAEVEAFARLGNMDDLAKAMIEQRQFQSWCARAPWAMFSLAPTLALAAAWAGCPVHSVVRLEYLPARSRHAFRRPPGRWVRESLFSIRQGDLLLRANTCRLGNRGRRCPSPIEGDLACRRSNADRADRRREPGPRESHSHPRIRTHQHELQSRTHRARRLSGWPATCRNPSCDHSSSLSHLEIARGLEVGVARV